MERKKITGLVMAAGRGVRLGGDIPKQFQEIDGRPVLYYTLKVLQDSPLIDSVIIVAGADRIAFCGEEIVKKYGFTKVRAVIPGGEERYLSVWNALKYMKEFSDEEDRDGCVFIQDGVRPFINEEILSRAQKAVEEYHACAVGMPAKDTVKIADEDGFIAQTPARRLVWNIQTPQAFDFQLIYRAYEEMIESGRTDITDDAMIVEEFTDTRVKLVEGSSRNIKITTPEDLLIARAFFGQILKKPLT